MTTRAVKSTLADILPLRALFLQETNCQIRYNACHERGWTDSYLLTIDSNTVGFGSIKGQDIADRDTVFEFFVVPTVRQSADTLFRELLTASGAKYIECQSNDVLLTSMLFQFARNVSANAVLFADHTVTDLTVDRALFRRRRDDDAIFAHRAEPEGDYVVVVDDEVIASGGFLLHYNPPFADLFMEVREDRRRCGIGAFLLQEVKKQCYLAGRVPAARCGIDNTASHATLVKAGLRVCGFMLMGSVKSQP